MSPVTSQPGVENLLDVPQERLTERQYQTFDDDDSEDSEGYVDPSANSYFKNYGNIFNNLLKYTTVETPSDIVTCQISYDSTRAIAVLKESEYLYLIQMYDLETQEKTFEEQIGGDPNQYIKVKEVTQNSKGDFYAICYLDDGNFKIRTFGKEDRNQDAVLEEEFLVNKAIGIDDFTIPNHRFPDPFIVADFISDEKLFVVLFHNDSLTHYHFVYNFKERKIEGKVYSHALSNTSKENFPQKCFYNDHKKEVNAFYRQGQAFTIPLNNPENYFEDDISDREMGQMFMFNLEALIVNSSSRIVFFRQEYDENIEKRRWVQYHVLNKRGQIYFMKGNKRIQITTDTHIYFYIMDRKTLMPSLENVMNNYMECNMMMFGTKVNYCITYKQNQKDFIIYRRKYFHSFKTQITTEDYTNAQVIEVKGMNCFFVSKLDEIHIYCSTNLRRVQTIKLELEDSDSREPNQIISMHFCQNEEYLGVIAGKNLIKEEKQSQCFYILKREINTLTNQVDYQIFKRVCLHENQDFQGISMKFIFKNQDGLFRDTCIFANKDRVFELNFETEKLTTFYKFQNPLFVQPQFFEMNTDQDVLIVSSEYNAIFININDNYEMDMDEVLNVQHVKNLVFDGYDNSFYLVSNKYKEKLGLYLVKVFQDEPTSYQFILKWKNKLSIDDVSISLINNQEQSEMIISYKSIYINTQNVIVADISKINQQNLIFSHESFQLWEQKMQSMLLSSSFDLVTVTKNGVHCLALGDMDKRVINNIGGTKDIMIHSLDSYNFLKMEESNHLYFNEEDSTCTIAVRQEFIAEDGDDNENEFQDIYNVYLQSITLRELLLFKSLYACDAASQITELVGSQPIPVVFYSSFLELDGSNMVSMLAFDSRSLLYLLSDEFDKYFSSDFPIFYRQKIQKGRPISYSDPSLFKQNNKYFFRSAIDNALKNNQVLGI